MNEVWSLAAPSSGFLLQTGKQQMSSGEQRNQCDKVQKKQTEHTLRHSRHHTHKTVLHQSSVQATKHNHLVIELQESKITRV